MQVGQIVPQKGHCGAIDYGRALISGLGQDSTLDLQIVGFSLENGRSDLDFELEGRLKHLDSSEIVHIQAAKSWYTKELLEKVVAKLKSAEKKVVITAHSHIWEEHNLDSIDALIVHSTRGRTILHHNVIEVPLGFELFSDDEQAQSRRVTCIGLRSDPNSTCAAMDRIGGGVLNVLDTWQDRSRLVQEMLRSQAVVINYQPQAPWQPSKAATMACGIPRPLLVPDIPEFSHVRDMPGVAVFSSGKQLSLFLEIAFDDPQALRHAQDRQKYIISRRLSHPYFVRQHIQIYNKML